MNKKLKLTPWFPGSIKPVRPGVYQQNSYSERVGYQRWDMSKWYAWCETPQAAKKSTCIVHAFFQNDSWRGLAVKP